MITEIKKHSFIKSVFCVFVFYNYIVGKPVNLFVALAISINPNIYVSGNKSFLELLCR